MMKLKPHQSTDRGIGEMWQIAPNGNGQSRDLNRWRVPVYSKGMMRSPLPLSPNCRSPRRKYCPLNVWAWFRIDWILAEHPDP